MSDERTETDRLATALQETSQASATGYSVADVLTVLDVLGISPRDVTIYGRLFVRPESSA